MKRAVIYGTGKYYLNNRNKLPNDIEIIAYADSSAERATSHSGKVFNDLKILLPDELPEEDFDVLYICTDYINGNRIYMRLKDTGIDMKKVQFLNRIDTLENGWDYEIQDDKSIISKIGNVRVRERFLTDFDIVTEIFVMNTYKFHIPAEEIVVIDMGMNIGVASLYFANMDKVVYVYGFEPFPDTYQQAVENFALNDDSIKNKILPYNIAVTDKEEVKTITVSAEQTGWRNIFCNDNEKRKVEIQCKPAEDIVSRIIRENLGRKIVMKIDVEGSEFIIFENLGKTDLLKSVDAILMEYHGKQKVITDILAQHDFKYTVFGETTGIGMLYAFK